MNVEAKKAGSGREGKLRQASAGGGPGSAHLADTVAFWEPHSGRKLTPEDARQIRENITGFFRVLLEWDNARKARDGSTGRAA